VRHRWRRGGAGATGSRRRRGRRRRGRCVLARRRGARRGPTLSLDSLELLLDQPLLLGVLAQATRVVLLAAVVEVREAQTMHELAETRAPRDSDTRAARGSLGCCRGGGYDRVLSAIGSCRSASSDSGVSFRARRGWSLSHRARARVCLRVSERMKECRCRHHAHSTL